MASCIVVAALVAACARTPGPHRVDFGEVQFWEASGDGEVTFGDACTDADSFRDDITAPEFPANSFLMFRIAEDGETAVAQDCTRIDTSTCVDNELGLVFEIDVDAHTYTAELAPQVLATSSPQCDMELGQTWTLEDLGETLTLDMDLPTTLVGDPAACAAVETAVVDQGTNGQGIDGCIVNLHVDTEYTASID